MARVKEFDPEDEGGDRVTEDGVTSSDPTLSIELTPIKQPPRVSQTQARAAANMRYHGARWEEIADFLGYKDPATARAVVEAHIAKTIPDESRESLFRLTSIRLEDLYNLARAKANPTVWVTNEYEEQVEESNPEQIAFIKVGLDILGRQMKLHGLEAPTQVQITPNLERFEEVVQRMTSAVRGDDAVEADVVEYAEIETRVEEGDFDA